MGGVNKCVKYCMFFFNFIFWICGCVILGVSIYARTSDAAQEIIHNEIDMKHIHSAMNILIAVGSIIMVLGFLGCCGALKESRCMLLMFFIGLLLILIIQITGAVVGIVFKSKVENIFNEAFKKKLNTLTEDNQEAEKFQQVLNKTQAMFKCCGLINGPDDWGKNFDKYEASCLCHDSSENLCMDYKKKQVYKQSCGNVIIKYLKNNLLVIVGIAFGTAVIEILGLVFSMVLYRQIGGK